MSVHLFNTVIDVVLAQLDPELGTEVGGMQVNHGAFADDIALYAVTPAGLQALADDLNHQLGLCGLEISTGLTGKSHSLRIDVDGRAKKCRSCHGERSCAIYNVCLLALMVNMVKLLNHRVLLLIWMRLPKVSEFFVKIAFCINTGTFIKNQVACTGVVILHFQT